MGVVCTTSSVFTLYCCGCLFEISRAAFYKEAGSIHVKRAWRWMPGPFKALVSHYQPLKEPQLVEGTGWGGGLPTQRQPSRPLFLFGRVMENTPMLICPRTTLPEHFLLVWRQHFIRVITPPCFPAVPLQREAPWRSLLLKNPMEPVTQ